MIPDRHSGQSAFLRCELLSSLSSVLHHGLLCSGVCLAPSVMGCPQPPNDSKEDGPGSGKDVVGEEQVSEIESLFGILLVE